MLGVMLFRSAISYYSTDNSAENALKVYGQQFNSLYMLPDPYLYAQTYSN